MASHRARSVVALLTASVAGVGCARTPEGIDLLRSERSRLAEARPQRIRNVVRD